MSDYFRLDAEYTRWLGGLRWADADALEDGAGRTFALAAEVRAFLEGFEGRRPLMHFAHVLHFLCLLRRGRAPAGRHDFEPLARAWREAGRPARTAGAFCAVLCQEVPSLPDALRRPAGWAHLDGKQAAEEPPFTPDVFESFLACALTGYRPAELAHWFRFGAAPADVAGEEVAAELLARKPRPLDGVLAELSRHDRLSGAVPYVAQLVGALSLPPRRLIDHELPIGGYSDVTTRGQPDALLPSQFALDELEFLRRHAQNELLYYRREEPSSRAREELLVVLDQGVRTWGRVRLTLAAAVFALGRLAQRRRLGFRVATTAGDDVVDPTRAEPTTLAEALAASDLGANPAAALERALLLPGDGPRDVVVLTHPRNLGEADVAAAARRLRRGDRLFAVAADADGRVTFHELRHGAPVTLGRFRLERAAPAPPPPPARSQGWAGDCEAVGFPFRFGVGAAADGPVFDFDHAGERLLVAWQHGMLLAVRTDGTAWEMVSRPLVNGRVLTDVHQVIGVAGGFVVIGGVPGALVASHYDFAARHVRLFTFSWEPGQLGLGFEWRYHRGRHALLLRAGEQFHLVHLATGTCTAEVSPTLRWTRQPPGQPVGEVRYALRPRDRGDSWTPTALIFDAARGDARLDVGSPTLLPLSDGRPALRGHKLARAAFEGGVLAALFVGPGPHKDLWQFLLPEGSAAAVIPLPYDRDAFGLSPDGRLLAVQRGACQLEVRNSGAGGTIRCLTPVGRYHNNVTVELGERWLALSIDRTTHVVEWAGGVLARRLFDRSAGAQAPLPPYLYADGTRARPGRLPGFLSYDPARFRLAAWSNLIAVVDLYGEVFLFEQTGELVCAFFAFRAQLAGWMPDGTCLGPEVLLGRRETPDAARRIGEALAQAWERGERTVT